MTGFGFKPTEVSCVVIRQGACRVATLHVLATFAVIDIYREILAGIPVQAAVTCVIPSVDKNLMVTHAHL